MARWRLRSIERYSAPAKEALGAWERGQAFLRGTPLATGGGVVAMHPCITAFVTLRTKQAGA
jgi:hypothetical protein